MGDGYQEERACSAAQRALDVFDECCSNGIIEGSFAGHSASTILLWKASALHVLVLHAGGSGANKLAQELTNALHRAHYFAMTEAKKAKAAVDENEQWLNAAAAALQLGWFFYIASDRNSDDSLNLIHRGLRSLHCAGRALIRAWEKKKSVNSPLLYRIVALAARVEHGIAGLTKCKSVTVPTATLEDVISPLGRAIRLLHFPSNQYIGHMAVASLPTPSLVDTRQGPCAALLLAGGYNIQSGDGTFSWRRRQQMLE